MRSLTDIQDIFFDWIDGLSVVASDSIIWRDQKAPKPTKPAITMKLSALNTIGQDWVSPNADETTGQVTIAGNREIVLALEGIGPGSMGNLERIRSSLERPSIVSYFFTNKVAYVNPLSEIIDTTALTDETREERYTLDLLFRFTQDQLDPETPTDPAEYIDTVNVDREVTNGVDLVFDDTFTIPPT